jgi:hypothetical protein
MSLFDPQRWGLPNDAIDNLADRLRGFCSRFKDCFKTKTHHTSEYGWVYLRGILTMDSDRNYANIARRVIAPDDDGQNLQHFILLGKQKMYLLKSSRKLKSDQSYQTAC